MTGSIDVAPRATPAGDHRVVQQGIAFIQTLMHAGSVT
jgi:hypothetical protein